MNTKEDEKWQGLLLRSASTFTGEEAPPYGFITGTLARLRAEKRQMEEFERIGWHALIASLVTLVAVVSITVGIQLEDRNNLEPGVRSIIAMDNVPVS